MRRGVMILAMATMAAVTTPARADAVLRRGGAPILTGEVLSADDAGVRIRTSSGAEHAVPWDRVREVRAQTPPLRLENYLETADTLWRARSRLERHDATLAEPLFERLWPEYDGRTHETALVVAEGLLRCRLARGHRAAAVVPALEVARLRRAGQTTDSYSALPAVLDESTSLSPRLAPAWTPSRALAVLERDLEAYDPQGDDVVATLRDLYLVAVRRAMGKDAPTPAAPIEHPGVDLLCAAVGCGSADSNERVLSRDEVFTAADPLAPWASAWARYAAGTSLLSEIGTGRRQKGLLNLAYLPTLHARRQPFLARDAMTRMIDALRGMGDAGGAASLTEAYIRLYGAPPPVEAVSR